MLIPVLHEQGVVRCVVSEVQDKFKQAADIAEEKTRKDGKRPKFSNR